MGIMGPKVRAIQFAGFLDQLDIFGSLMWRMVENTRRIDGLNDLINSYQTKKIK
jgi:hypothetical protein